MKKRGGAGKNGTGRIGLPGKVKNYLESYLIQCIKIIKDGLNNYTKEVKGHTNQEKYNYKLDF